MSARKSGAVFRITLANQWVYTADALFRAAFLALIVLVYVHLWTRTLATRGSVAGLIARELVWYLVYTEALMLAFPRFDETISEEVKSGEIAYRLLRPMSYLSFHQAAYLGEMVFRFAANLLVGAAVAWLAIGAPPWDPVALPAVLVLSAGAMVLSFWTFVCLALLAFWVEETRPFFWIYHKMMFTVGGLLVPNDLFPAWLKSIADWLPFGAILYAPARLTVRWDAGLALHTLVVQVVWCALAIGLARHLFARGVRQLDVNGG